MWPMLGFRPDDSRESDEVASVPTCSLTRGIPYPTTLIWTVGRASRRYTLSNSVMAAPARRTVEK